MAVAGSDVYFAGLSSNTLSTSVDSTRIVYWKNGVANYLPNSGKAGLATGIAVSGSDSYVTGYSYDLTYSAIDEPSSVFWKNGVLDSLSIPGNQAQTTAVAVQGSDVYIAGSSDYLGSLTVAEYWPV